MGDRGNASSSLGPGIKYSSIPEGTIPHNNLRQMWNMWQSSGYCDQYHQCM